MDLARAEAVANMVEAGSHQALRAAAAQLRGDLSQRISALRSRLVGLRAEVEAGIDFVDDPEVAGISAANRAEAEAVMAREIEALAATYRQGRAAREGLVVVLLGATNAGKSSLLNALCGEERVLVSAEPGTTRDYVEVSLEWQGFQVTLVDTAGGGSMPRGASGTVPGTAPALVPGVVAHKTTAVPAPEDLPGDDLGRRAWRLGRSRARSADVVLWVVDGQRPGGEGDDDDVRREGERLEQAAQGIPALVVANKQDLPGWRVPSVGGVEVVAASARTGSGLDDLRRKVLEMAGVAEGAETGDADLSVERPLVTDARHAAALASAKAAVSRAEQLARGGGAAELEAMDLREAAQALGEITGEEVEGEVLDAIFGRFCLGK
jgi:tRNA modification GTPase